MHHDVHISVDEQLVLSPKFKRNLYIALAIGIILFVIGVAMAAMGGGGHDTHSIHGAEATQEITEAVAETAHHGPTWMTRMWADLWHNSVFFSGIALLGVFFMCVQYVAWAGWSSILKRIPESFGSFLPIGGALLLVIFLVANHDIFHWTHEGLTDPKSPEYDKIIAGKSGYLNVPFFLTRMVVFFGLWYFMWTLMRKQSLLEDQHGGDSYYHKSGYISAIFLFIFGISVPMAGWDWVMSIDTHWFSTMFWVYNFASWWVSSLSAITLICIYLKENGYLKGMNDNHFHDLGKFMFAFSIFWAYIFLGQWLLIFYANIPEETVYFLDRTQAYDKKYTFLFFFLLFINFVFPFLWFMTRDSKRKTLLLKIGGIGLIFGHWLDFYVMIMPGVTKGTSEIGFMEIGLLIAFVSLFIIIITNTLTKAKLIPQNHPMLEESLHHSI